jgi:hypothetical protein
MRSQSFDGRGRTLKCKQGQHYFFDVVLDNLNGQRLLAFEVIVKGALEYSRFSSNVLNRTRLVAPEAEGSL